MRNSLSRIVLPASMIALGYLANPASLTAQDKKYNILADELKSKEVLVNWDKSNDRAYTGTGIPIMTPQDTLNLPDKVKGNYELVIYDSPRGVTSDNNTIFTSENVEEGIINGALIYRNEKGKITESVRVIVPVFRGIIDSEKISELEKKITQMKEKPKRKEKKKYEEKPSARFSADFVAGEEELIGGNIGVGYGPVALAFNYSQKQDETVDRVRVPLSVGREGIGSRKETGFESYGAALELHPYSWFFLGGGANQWNFTTRVDERIVSDEGEVLRANSNSKSENQTSARFYAGLKVPVSDKLSFRFFGGHDSRTGAFGGVGGSFNLSKQKHRTQHRK